MLGVYGLLYSTNKGSAVKAHQGMRLFEQELRVYQRLARYPEKPVPGFNVPKMVDFHTELWVIEMQPSSQRIYSECVRYLQRRSRWTAAI